jgi:predicted 3-demethylubiquinone-9 3-methyltransferase (glyoxalase superfamily)
MQTITPFLWFNNNAEEAMNFYASVFKNSAIGSVSRMPSNTPGPGPVITGEFTLLGQKFMVLNGGEAGFEFNESVSLFVSVETQDEVDYYWDALTVNDGEPGRCGWLKDQFGLSWQIVPTALGQLMSGPAAGQVVTAMLQMNKLDIQGLRDAVAS